MAEKTEFLQAIDDAILDADSLERFINGDDTQDVLTRLSKRYPTLQKALKELFENGGIADRFKTLTDLQASPLVDGDYALVADDVDDKNGIYIKEGGAWVKSKYDPLTDAISFAQSADEQVLDDAKNYTNSFIYNDGSNRGLFYTDKNGNVIFYVLDDGSVHAHGLEKPLQEYVLGEYTQDDTALLEVVGSSNLPFVRIESDAGVRLPGLKSTVQNEFKELRSYNNLALSAVKIPDSQAREVIVNAAQDVVDEVAVSKRHVVQSKEWGEMPFGYNARMPSLLGLPDNKILLVWGEGGDSFNVTLYKRVVTYTIEGDIVDWGVRELLAKTSHPEGVTKHPMLCLDKNGAIVLMYDKRDSADTMAGDRQVVCKSYDGGVTFTTPKQLEQPSWSTHRGVANGSTGNMVLLDNGRIVCPAWSLGVGEGICTIYSDDDGDTWTYTNPMRDAYTRDGITLQEPAIAKLGNGDLLFSCRTQQNISSMGYVNRKYMCISRDNGLTVEDVGFNYDLVAPDCASSMFYDDNRGLLLHASPTQPEYGRKGYYSQISGRQRARVQVSADNGATFKVASKILDVRDSDMYGYSTITKIGEDLYAIIYEGVSSLPITNSQESMGLVIFNLKGVFSNVVNS